MGGLLKNIKLGQGGLLKAATGVVGTLGKGLVSGASTLIQSTVSSAGGAAAQVLNSKGGAAFGGSASSIFGGKPVDKETMANIMSDGGSGTMAGRGAAKDTAPSGDGLTAPKTGIWKYLTFYKMNYETGYFLLDEKNEKQFSWLNAIIVGGVVTITWLLSKKKRSSGTRSRRPARRMSMRRTYKRR